MAASRLKRHTLILNILSLLFAPFAETPLANHSVDNKWISLNEFFGRFVAREYIHRAFGRVCIGPGHEKHATRMELVEPGPVACEVSLRFSDAVLRHLIDHNDLHRLSVGIGTAPTPRSRPCSSERRSRDAP